jgi:3-oxoacyl-(acyl-carrier-protein) synthase
LAAAPAAEYTPTDDRPYWGVPDDVLDDYPHLSNELKRDKGAWMTAVALEHACGQASLDRESFEPERVGMVLGCALAGQLGMINFANEVRQQSPRFVSPLHFPQTVGNYISGALARAYQIRGPNATLSCGSASGLDAIAEGVSLLSSGAADVVFAGGTERLSEELVAGLADLNAPVGEGACLFVLERLSQASARGVVPLATVVRSAHSSGTGDPSPDPAKMIVSAAGLRLAGAIVVEHWTGRCFAAAGPAAVAAAIAAAQGRDLPKVDVSDPDHIAIGPISPDGLQATDGTCQAVIVADADGAHRTILELAVPAAQ